MANEAYRAVFLRVHPTGKMVLSLTTGSDGKEAEYARLVGEELGVPALDVKVVPADTDRFGVGHGFNTSPSDGTPAAIASATAKIPVEGDPSKGGKPVFNINAKGSQLRIDVRAPEIAGAPRFYYENDFYGSGGGEFPYRIRQFYGQIYREDDARIQMLERRYQDAIEALSTGPRIVKQVA
jgi:hypothetical protein